MAKGNRWVKEFNFLLFAALLTLSGILTYGVLVDTWIKEPKEITMIYGYTFAAITATRMLM